MQVPSLMHLLQSLQSRIVSLIYLLKTSLEQSIHKPFTLMSLRYLLHILIVQLIPHTICRQNQVPIVFKSLEMTHLWLVVNVWPSENWQVCEVVFWMFQIKVSQWPCWLQAPFHVTVICILYAFDNIFLIWKLFLQSLFLLWLTCIQALVCFCWLELSYNNTLAVARITDMNGIFQDDGS